MRQAFQDMPHLVVGGRGASSVVKCEVVHGIA